MIKIKYISIFLLLLTCILYADTKKVYFYTSDNHINNYKSLKINFEEYLSRFGDYEFQAFSDKDTFEKYLQDENVIVLLSSWHYLNINKFYNIEAKFVAKKKNSVKDTKVLIGKKGQILIGNIATSYNKEYTNKLLSLFKNDQMDIIEVPKEIDALMSVGFGISQYAIVSKNSYEQFIKINTHLSKDLTIYNETKANYRMLIASKNSNKKSIDIFKGMLDYKSGKKVLNLLGVDDFISLTTEDIKDLGGTK